MRMHPDRVPRIRGAETEWEGRQCCLTFRVGQPLFICHQRRQEALCLGKVLPSRHTARSRGQSTKGFLVNQHERVRKLRERIEQYDDFLELRGDPEIAGLLWSKYSTESKIREDSQQIKLEKRSTMELRVAYLEERGEEARLKGEGPASSKKN